MNKKTKDEVIRALACLEMAEKIFTRLHKECEDKKDWRYHGDFGYYKSQIGEIISSDDGEAGLKAFIGIVEGKSK